MGEVWSAQDVLLGRKVAVKLGSGDHPGGVLLREARLAASVSHPNVIGVFDAGTEGGRSYVVMELVDGVTLAERLRTGRIDAREAHAIALQAARALAAAHAEDVVHCDVKPGNVLLDPSGRVVVTDFGIARRTGTGPDRQPVYGTVPYLAPEPLAGLAPTSASDVFSLAVVLVELFGGGPAFDAADPDGLRAAHRAGPRFPSGLPGELVGLLGRCLTLDPSGRPSAAEVVVGLADLSTAASRGAAATEHYTSPIGEAATVAIPVPAAATHQQDRPTRPTSRRRRALAVLAVAGLLAIAALARIASLGGTPPVPATAAPTRPSPAVTVTPTPTPTPTTTREARGGDEGPHGKGSGHGHGKGHGRHGQG